MAQKDVQALGDDILGQVAGGRAVSEAEKKALNDALKKDPNRGWNYWDAHGIDPHSKSNPFTFNQ